MNRNHLALIAMTLLVATAIGGCDSNQKVADIAIESAERQAEQNRDLADVHKELASGSKELVAGDAAAREGFVQLHQEVQSERRDLAGQWNELEAERRDLATQRRTESMLATATRGTAIGVVVILALLLAWLVLFRAHTDPDTDRDALELLMGELTHDTRQLTHLSPRLPTSVTERTPILPPDPTASEQPEP